ncbi:CopY/TcrY family copper transport repressor [Lacticaseibacillus nasuensis]|uniref:CopY/TcrY family copper transport repressor n=1 Tax=Lacticaseibacillus nasuensis TaxID=944671 RepID=UPI0022468302|nr:CopY/TcrY family copper transport repressor [Lacticaseibacillus nasuensis]MCX2454741.1 CopY/TcrY family copper transport repressor [Lacticaseibacillus nasuensis]
MAVEATAMSPSEWEVMRVVWSTSDPATPNIVKTVQQKRDWSESTIKTWLGRLVRKGLLTTKRVSHSYVYTPTIAEVPAMKQTAGELFDHLCAMKKGTVIADLVTNTELSRRDIEQLQQILAAKLPTAPESVPCNCMGEGACAHD